MGEVVTSPLGVVGSAAVALTPVLCVLVGLGVLRARAERVCAAGLLIAAALALTVWRLSPRLTLLAVFEGGMLAVWPILWVIFAAIFTYNVTVDAGAMDEIRSLLAAVSADRRVQALVIAWGFGAFLEGVAGFGTAVAIAAAILIGLGFDPRLAAVVCLLANTAPVAFGGAGLPVITLARVTGLDQRTLGVDAALQLTPLVLLLPLALALVITRRTGDLKGVVGAALAAGLGFAAPALALASWIGPELPTILGALCSILAVVLWVRVFPPRTEWRFAADRPTAPEAPAIAASARRQLRAWSPYVIMLALFLAANGVAPVRELLGRITTRLTIYDGPGGSPLPISWILTPGTLIMTAAIAGGRIQGASARVLAGALRRTGLQLARPAATIIALVAMARVMTHSGMIGSIAVALAAGAGPLAPLLAPFIGALGAFVTGSDTNSNVLFGSLQQQTALLIGAESKVAGGRERRRRHRRKDDLAPEHRGGRGRDRSAGIRREHLAGDAGLLRPLHPAPGLDCPGGGRPALTTVGAKRESAFGLLR